MDIYKFVQKLIFSIMQEGYYSILRHSEECLFPSPKYAFYFTDLSCLVLETFRFFEKHAQNLNTPQNNSVSWYLQLGFNLELKGLKITQYDTWK